MGIFGTRRRLRKVREIAPDEVFLDASNLPGLDMGQFEGRVERPLSQRSIVGVGVVFVLVALIFTGKAGDLQIAHGEEYAQRSANNTLRESIVFASRGIIYDRAGRELAWNTPQVSAASSTSSTSTSTSPHSPNSYALRAYSDMPGLAHIVGFLRYPKADRSGNWWQETYTGVSGVEADFNETLAGTNGSTVEEVDAHGTIERTNITIPSESGTDVHLSIDAELQSKLYETLWAHAQRNSFRGGAAVVMDVRTGEVIAITSFPEYDHAAFVAGDSATISAQSGAPSTPLLDRAVGGLYAPGSIVKPIFAAAALNEGIISPNKQIDSVGQIVIPNPYNPDQPTVFRDWTVHGPVDMRTAIAVSSDEYFYTIGGGYGGQEGLGITRLDTYARAFGLGQKTGIALSGEQAGNIPTPEWKARVFSNDPWRIGNTYHTAIGQYGFQVTPIQAVRFAAAIANGGRLLTPQIIASTTAAYTTLDIPDEYLQVVREGMRMAVTSDRSDATVKALNIAGVQIAAKTGTAQIGTHNQWMNSWNIGFWPADDPHYAYAVVLEHAPAGTLAGAAPGIAPFFYWLRDTHPEYLR